jgi:glycosyltransferase involved in cell wall biosynthesis
MKIRVLHVLDKISIDSGVSSLLMNYYVKLDHAKITFDFMLNEEADAKLKSYIESCGSKIYVMPRLKIANSLKYIKALRQFYKSHDYKIIHGHIANSAILYLGLAKNIPYKIIHSHSIKSSDVPWKRFRNWFLTRFIKQVANSYIACSKESADFLFKSDSNVTILHNAIDVEKFIFNKKIREKIRSSLGLEDEILIGHVGRFEPVKNHHFLIDVFNEVYNKNKNTRLLLIGDGPIRGNIINKVNKLGLGKAVLFLGAVHNVEDYMNAMDVLVLPSLFEGFGLVGIEAQASGLKVLASEYVPRSIDVTGNIDYLKLYKDVWVEKIINMEASFNEREDGDKLKGSKFDIKIQVFNLCEYYKKLLGNNPMPPAGQSLAL